MTKVPYQKIKNDLTKFAQILPRYMDAAHRGSVLLSLFIYFGCTFGHFYCIYISALNKDTRYQN